MLNSVTLIPPFARRAIERRLCDSITYRNTLRAAESVQIELQWKAFDLAMTWPEHTEQHLSAMVTASAIKRGAEDLRDKAYREERRIARLKILLDCGPCEWLRSHLPTI